MGIQCRLFYLFLDVPRPKWPHACGISIILPTPESARRRTFLDEHLGLLTSSDLVSPLVRIHFVVIVW